MSGGEEDTWTQSTPVDESERDFKPGVTPSRNEQSSFVFLDKPRNLRRALNYDPDLTMLRDTNIPIEHNPIPSALWKDRPQYITELLTQR